ncbi:hypothetical protein SAMN07250955_10235 [Arboricoccus pini]|uniref:DUF2076 domain-containing protein n=1 Tax=Arboricoccus pini TaxID=1963835 RepID=A0A212QMU6_9PROT|nr:DUF2076 domain-containing protein [Arboricoccus pini]SNB60720.1 hypothetical protein SAMN07250955_10235 [Arboricoccus pini]
MTPDERKLLEGLFDRLDRNAGAGRDEEADRFIGEQMAKRPYAAYFLAQSVLVQEAALAQAEAKLRQAERPREEEVPSFMPRAPVAGPWGVRPTAPAESQSLRFGSQPGVRPAPAPTAPQAYGQPQAGYAAQQPYPQTMSGGGSFLRGAAQTAVGVAGGYLAAEAISGLFSHGGGLGGYGSAGYAPGETIIENQTINETIVEDDGQDAAGQDSTDDPAQDASQDADYDTDAGYDSGYSDDGFDGGDGSYDV